MADRTISVRLQALTQDYARDMQRAGDATQRTGEKFQGTERNSAGLAGVISTRLLPLLGGAGLVRGFRDSFNAAAELEGSLVRMETLVGLSTEQVEALAGGFDELSTATGISVQELADAAFFITSAGLRGEDAMDALEFAAKGAAIGLGETAAVADVLTSAMNAYGPEVLSAGEATDVLVAAVRNGKAEAPELSGALGRVLPIASEMGVSFDEVAAATAAMTRTGSDAATATTSLRGILMAMLRPSQDAEQAMQDLGLSSAMMRDMLRNEGLLAALDLLTTSAGGNEEALARVIPEVEGLTGVMDLMGANVDETRAIFGDMTDTVGVTDEAMERYAETGEFQSQRLTNAWGDFKRSFTEDAMPAVAGALEGATWSLENGLAEAALWGDVNELSLNMAETLAGVFIDVKGGAQDAEEGVAAFSKSVDDNGESAEAWRGQADAYVDQLIGMADESRDAAGASDDLTDAAGDTEGQLDDTGDAADDLREAYDRLIGIVIDAVEAEMNWIEALQDVEEQIVAGDDALNIHTETGRDNIRMLQDGIEAAFDHGAALMDNGASADEAAGQVQNHIAALMDQAREAGLTEDQIEELIEMYGLTPSEVRTVMQADTRDAEELAEEYESVLNRLPRRVTTTVSLNLPAGYNATTGAGSLQRVHTGGYVSPSGSIQRFHEGGMVGGLRSDEVPAILQTGEVVLSRQQVAALGGALSSSQPKPSSAATSVDITVNNPTAEPASTSISRTMRMVQTAGVFG